MYYMLKRKLTVWLGNLSLSQKNRKTPKIMDNFSDMLTWALDADEMTPGQLLGYNGSNWLCGRSVASKLSLQQADGF